MANQSMLFHFLGLLSTPDNLAYNSELYYPNLSYVQESWGNISIDCLDQGPIWVKEHLLGEGSKSVYLLEEGVRDSIGEVNRHFQWKVYNKEFCNLSSIIRLSGSNICPLLAIDLRQDT